MSIKAMSFVWDLEIPHDEKFVLLAYADHANDNGASIFPAILTVAKKTSYSRRSIQEITRKLQKRGLLLPNGRGRHNTNSWRIPLNWRGADSAPVQDEASRGAEQDIESMLQTAPEPLRNIKEPSVKEAPKAKATTPDEVKIFREVTERYPNKINFADVALIIQGVSKRLQRLCTAEDLRPFYAAWVGRGYRPTNLAWLSWAESGVIPQNGNKPNTNEPKGFEAIRAWASKQEELQSVI